MISVLYYLSIILPIFHIKKEPLLFSTDYFYSQENADFMNTPHFEDSFFVNIGEMSINAGAIISRSGKVDIQVINCIFTQCKSLTRGAAIEVSSTANLDIIGSFFDRCFTFESDAVPAGISIFQNGETSAFSFKSNVITSFNSNDGQAEIYVTCNVAEFESVVFSDITVPNTIAYIVSGRTNMRGSNISNTNYPKGSAAFFFGKDNYEYETIIFNCFFKNLKSSNPNDAAVLVFRGICFLNATLVSFVDCSPYSIAFHDKRSLAVMNDYCFSTNKKNGFFGEFQSEFITGTFNDKVCDRRRVLGYLDVWTYRQTIALIVGLALFISILLYVFVIHICLIHNFHKTFNELCGYKLDNENSSD